MSTEINDGGPAFPLPAVYDSGRDEVHAAAAYGISAGMSLRDYFAAKVLPAIYELTDADFQKNGCPDPSWRYGVALDAYMMADAMLRARAATKEQS